MEIKLDQEQTANIKALISDAIKKGVKQVTNERPYLNRTDIAKYFGVSPTTIGVWASKGMPVAVVDGRKLYGKQSITAWIRRHEQPLNGKSKQEKRPATMRLVTSN